MSALVLVERIGRTSVVTLNRPQVRNALNREIVCALRDELGHACADAAIRCIVIGGTGGHFCAGADLRELFANGPPPEKECEVYLDEFQALVKSIVCCDKPTIVMMEGAAVGFGADLAFCCDLRVASEGAYAQEKFVAIGLMPDGGGSFWLPRLLGTARAMQMLLLAEPLPAAELLRLGIVTQVVEPRALREHTLSLARRLERGPALAFAAIKRALYGSWGSVEDALRRERAEQLRLLGSRDAKEGIAAWLERREAVFTGA